MCVLKLYLSDIYSSSNTEELSNLSECLYICLIVFLGSGPGLNVGQPQQIHKERDENLSQVNSSVTCMYLIAHKRFESNR